jgi:hypothetical protein
LGEEGGLLKTGETILYQLCLKGQELYSLSLTWAPYFTLQDCDENGKNCMSQTGFIADVMDVLGSQFNFTWSSDKEPNGDWGLKTKNGGPYNRSAQWGGVMGALINDEVFLIIFYIDSIHTKWVNSKTGKMDYDYWCQFLLVQWSFKIYHTGA